MSNCFLADPFQHAVNVVAVIGHDFVRIEEWAWVVGDEKSFGDKTAADFATDAEKSF